MRFLGYGIGHKNQTKFVVPSNGDNGVDRGLELHNMAQRVHQPCKPPPHKVHNMDDAQDDDESDDTNSNSSEDDSDTESTGNDDLDGYF